MSESKSSPWLALFAAGTAGAILLTVVCLLAWKVFYRTKPTLLEETDGERSRSIQQAYLVSEAGSEVTDVSSDPRLAQIAEKFFMELGDAFRTQNRAQIENLVSADAMLDLVEQSGYAEFSSPFERQNFRRGFRQGLMEGLANFSGIMAFDDVDVLRIEKISGSEIIAYVRFWDEDLEIYQKMRWWLLEDSDSNWVGYDYEDFDTNIRNSALMGILLADGGRALNSPWFHSFQAVMQQMQVEDSLELTDAVAGMEGEVDLLLSHDLPEEIESFGRILKTGSLIANGEFQQGLEQLDRIDAIKKGIPVVHYQRGVCFLNLENWNGAVHEFEMYAAMLGWDSDVHEMISDAHYGAGDLAKAVEHAESGLADNPDAWGCLMSFSIALAENRWPEIRQHASRTSDPESVYEWIIDYAVEEDKIDLAEHVFNYLKEAFPESWLIEYYDELFEELPEDA